MKALQEFAIDELLIVEEYQEFVRLLRRYISIQEPKISLLHVLHIEGHHFLIYNENKEEITEEEIETYLQAWAGHKIIYEGMMVSTLISTAPQTIVVHTESTELNVITTLKKIFQDRLHICKSCTDCTKWKEKEYKRFKKTPTNT